MRASRLIGVPMPLGIDEYFLRRVYRTAIPLALFAAFGIWIYGGGGAALSFLIGSGVSLGLLRMLEYAVRRYLVLGRSRARPMLLIVMLVKVPALGVLFYFLLSAEWLNLIGLVVGLGLAQLIIVLKAVGIAVFSGSNKELPR